MNRLLLPFVFAAMGYPLSSVPADEKVDVKQAGRQIIQLTNDFRKEHQLEAVQMNEEMQAAAEKFAQFMAESDKYGHGADGRTPAQRVEAAGYDYCMVRENIAYRVDPSDLNAETLAQKFTQGWIDSPEHRENMLADYISDTGVAIATTDGQTYYAVQLFGRPKSKSYKLTLLNRTDQPYTVRIESNGGSDEIDVAPRVRLRMQRCFPMTLSLVDTDVRQRFRSSQNVVIESSDDGPRIVPSDE
ncbi:MAG: CAP domain-containing protein [Pirellulaceae bacterium]